MIVISAGFDGDCCVAMNCNQCLKEITPGTKPFIFHGAVEDRLNGGSMLWTKVKVTLEAVPDRPGESGFNLCQGCCRKMVFPPAPQENVTIHLGEPNE